MTPADSRIRFNPWKHHLLWVKNQVEDFLRNNSDLQYSQEDLVREINGVNNNQVDIYIGRLLPGELIHIIEDQLHQLNIFSRDDFEHWLSGKSGYRLLTLPDGSGWILRLGIEKRRYIHIHPARNSNYVVRLHGSSWKTVLIIKILGLDPENIDLVAYNMIRVKYLSLSPVKSLMRNARLWRTMCLIWNENR